MTWEASQSPSINIGMPTQSEGIDGDIQIRQTNLGARLFGKVSGQWYSTALTAKEGEVTTRIGTNLSDHVSIDSDSVDIYKNSVKVAEFGSDITLTGGNITMDGAITMGNFSATSAGVVTVSSIKLSGVVQVTGTDGNVCIGTGQADLGDNNTLLGREAGGSINANADDNIAIGSYALASAAYDSIGGQANWNVAIGMSAGRAITTGYANICIGLAAGAVDASGKAGGPTGFADIEGGNGNILIGNLVKVDEYYI